MTHWMRWSWWHACVTMCVLLPLAQAGRLKPPQPPACLAWRPRGKPPSNTHTHTHTQARTHTLSLALTHTQPRTHALLISDTHIHARSHPRRPGTGALPSPPRTTTTALFVREPSLVTAAARPRQRQIWCRRPSTRKATCRCPPATPARPMPRRWGRSTASQPATSAAAAAGRGGTPPATSAPWGTTLTVGPARRGESQCRKALLLKGCQGEGGLPAAPPMPVPMHDLGSCQMRVPILGRLSWRLNQSGSLKGTLGTVCLCA